MKKNKMMKNLLQAGLVLSLLGGSSLPVFATLPVAAETVQVKTYELTAEEKAGIQEYTQAKLRVEMQEFYETVLKEMLDIAPELATKAWEEESADIEKTLTPEQWVVFEGIKQSLINSIAGHYHFLWTMRGAMGGYGIQEAKDTVAKYEEDDEAATPPEVELAALKYMKELILAELAKNKAAIEGYQEYAVEEEKKFQALFLQDTIDIEALQTQIIQYGQALATASQPEFPFDFTGIEQRIEELTRQLTPQPKEGESGGLGTNGSGNLPPTPAGQGDPGTGSNDQPGGTGENNPPENNTTGNQVRILPKTSSTQGMMLPTLGLFLVGLVSLLLAKRKTEKN
ncbi:LPXTG cell wall anchor domain-containing protein [Streptococcus acidominimus]|uniref:Surface protein from Gram-positive cocci, anchor region n=1 Tax=Streptococcus acidominimus TaxID=1326 RepID=A0A1Q8EE66_STRAI|nr:LPXTG cell wall anchor domain-containing protein [Streptococcus acidominimus]OLF50060.1 hypothetical protein BU200_04035 [Streptococcus acidominimus]SUN08064.1 Surface protein from Gram-positive cocci, anchor region [Streptococcus acidominimus]